MNFSWSIFVDLGIISLALLTVTLVKARMRFFELYLIPNSIIAGFVLLPFYSYIGPLVNLNTEGLGNLVFHLLNLSFIAMSLRTQRRKASGKGVFSMVIRVPITFPPEKFHGVILAGMCVPDLRGTQGSFTFFTTETDSNGEHTGGTRIVILREGQRVSGAM